MTRTRLIALLFALLVAVAAFGNVPAGVSPESGPLHLIALAEGAKEPDVAAMGGKVLQSWSGRRLIAVTAEQAEALRGHAGVAWVQRIGGDDASATTEHRAEASNLRRAPAYGGPMTTAAPPSWTTGVYAYDQTGNVKSMGADQFRYDSVGRIIHSVVQSQSHDYRFDKYGNLIQLGSLQIAVDETTNRLDEPAYAPLEYDEAGNLRVDANGRRYHYDAAGMVTAIDAASSDLAGTDLRMIYTADDERIVIAEGTSTTRYRLRDFSAGVLREWKSSAPGILEWERDYVYAGGDLVAGEVQVPQSKNGQRHYHTDHLGSIRMVTDGTGGLVARSDYYPFGAELPPTTTEFDNTGKAPRDPKKFTGHERDYFSPANAEGDYLDYMHARYYAPKLGRFLTVDPSQDDLNLARPQTWNKYAYVQNNPIIKVDPDGRVAETVWDVANVVMGVASFAANVSAGNVVGAVVDGIGVVVDVAATVTPIVPGGAGSIIKGIRAANKIDDAVDLAKTGRAGKQARLRELAKDPKVSSADRGWIKQDMDQVQRGTRSRLRNPPGKDLAHERGREAAKGYGYKHSNLQDRDLHRTQHRYDDHGRKNKERPINRTTDGS